MDGLTTSMLVAAVGVAFVHTALGPDHYLPFVMLSRARGWSLTKTLWITGACGVGHVASSLLLGAVGIAAGVALGAIESVEARRGAIAAWALFGVGVAYGLWGLRRALQKRRGVALHEHDGDYHLHGGGGEVHAHHHHGHSHAVAGNTTFWALFIVFVLGPCEPLIPLFMVPACQERWGAAIATAVVFALVTIATMLTITTMAVLGISRLPLQLLERWTHAMAGAVIAASAAMVLFLGL
jgi:nickel/cobalt exporter